MNNLCLCVCVSFSVFESRALWATNTFQLNLSIVCAWNSTHMHTELPEGERKLEFKLTVFPKKQRNPKNVPTNQSKGCGGWWRKTEKKIPGAAEVPSGQKWWRVAKSQCMLVNSPKRAHTYTNIDAPQSWV